MKRLLMLSLATVFLGIVGCGGVNQPIEGKNVTITPPPDVTIAQGAKVEQYVLITREKDKAKGLVTIKFEDLPKGVTIKEGKEIKIAEKDSQGTVTFVAADDADLVEAHKVTIIGYFKDKKVGKSKDFTITVQKKTLRKSFEKTQGEYEEAIKKKLKTLNSEIDELATNIKKGTKKANKATEEKLETLKKQYAKLKQRAEKIAATTQAEWAEFQRDTDQAYDELKKGVREAINEFKD